MTEQAADEPQPEPVAVPTPVRLAGVLQLVEGGLVAAAGVVWMVLTFAGRPGDLGASIMGALLATLFGALLVRLALAIGRGQQWARSPVVAIQILLLPIGFAMVFKGGILLYGIPVLAVSVLMLYLLFTKPAHAVFDREFPGR